MVIGLVKNATYEKETISLRPGDVLIFYTDGISEMRNANDEEFGEDRLTELVSANLHLPAAGLRDLILGRVYEFAGTIPQHDDITLVVIKAVDDKINTLF